MQPFWEKHPGLDKRLDHLAAIVPIAWPCKPRVLTDSCLDLAILPEAAITGEVGDDALALSVAFEGPVASTSAALLVASLATLSFRLSCACHDTLRCSNASVLVGRKGEVVGLTARYTWSCP